MSRHAEIAVIVRGRGEEAGAPATRGQEIAVLVNGHLIRARSIRLECAGRKAVATLVVDVDEVQITGMRAAFNVLGCGVEHNADGTISINHKDDADGGE